MHRPYVAAGLIAATLAVSSGCAAGEGAPTPPTGAATRPTDSGTATTVMPTDGQGWQLSHRADYSTFDMFRRVVAPAHDDAWAFGDADNRDRSPFAARWDGRQWAPSALPAGISGRIGDAGGSAPDDVWLFVNGRRISTALHWNGHGWMVRARLPFQTRKIKVLDRTRLWALPGDTPTSVWSFDGTDWRQVPFPDGVDGWAIDATPSGTLWAVGAFDTSGLRSSGLFRLDGDRWTRVPLGRALPADDDVWYLSLEGVVASGDDDIWVLGNRRERHDAAGEIELRRRPRPVAAHWDGRSWRAVAVPGRWTPAYAVSDGKGGVHAVVGPNPEEADAVAPTSALLSLTADGSASVSAPEVTGGRPHLTAVARAPGTLWAVGAIFPAELTEASSTSVIYRRPHGR
jgi:hypothetical protein